jgi:hypothetical protein
MVMLQVRYLNTIEGPDNPTSQLLPISTSILLGIPWYAVVCPLLMPKYRQ